MNILLMMFRAKRPSHIHDMRAVAKPFYIRKGYDGMTFFGHIITPTPQGAEAFNQRSGSLKNHEMIHLYQARSTHDSWLCFYWKYIWFWILASRYRNRINNAGYVLNPFEMEAYAHMHQPDYLQPGGQANEWKRYASMSLAERLSWLHQQEM